MAESYTTKNITTVEEVNTLETTDKIFVNDSDSLKQISLSNLMDSSDALKKNQGTENAGKTLVVGSDGNVIPGEEPVKVDSTLTKSGHAADAKATGDKISSLSEEQEEYEKYKEDNPAYTFRRGTIRNSDGYIIDGSKQGIYTMPIYLSKRTVFSIPSQYMVSFYRYNGKEYLGHTDNSVAESGFYRICIRHVDQSEIDIDEASKIIIDEKPRISQLEGKMSKISNDIANLESNLNEAFPTGDNIIDLSKCLANGTGVVDNKTGNIDHDGGVTYLYGPYKLDIGEEYTFSKDSSAAYIYFYNSDGSYAGIESYKSFGGANNEYTFNAEFPLILISALKDGTTMKLQLQKGSQKTTYTPYYKQLSPKIKITDKTLYNKKVLIIADSISTGDSSEILYPGEKYGGYNKWVDALIEEGFLNEYTTRNDSIHATGYVSTFAGADDYVSRLRNIANPESYDFVIINGCYNDWGHHVPIENFKSAVDEFYDYLINNFTQARILVLNSLKSFRWEYENDIGHYQTEYNDYIRETAKKYSFPFYDLFYESGFCPNVEAFRSKWTYYAMNEEGTGGVYDGVHPNYEWAYEFMAPMIKHFIEQYI